jgi:DNA polymerase III sliding clamp (beta) subunit (PCNA family)
MGFCVQPQTHNPNMKSITLPIAELKPALIGLGKVINSRATLPVLHHIKIERTSDGWIALTGTDLDRFVTLRLEHPAEGPPSSLLLPFDQLSQVVKSCGKGESIEVESTPEANVIRFPLGETLGESKFAFLSPEEFPATPKIKSDAIALPSNLRESIHEAMDCASVDSTRYVLNGTFIDTSNPKANYIVGTDGKHLYSANSFALPLKQSLIIPNHKFLGWKEFNSDGEWQMKVGNEHVQLSSRRWRFVSKTIEGNYPDWRAPIPNPADTETILTLDPGKLETLTNLIQRMPCYDAEKHQTLGLEWKAGSLMLIGKDKPEDEWLRVPVLDFKGGGPDLTIYLDRRYLIKALGFGLNVINLIDPMSPLRFNNGGKTLIVMPLRCVAPAVTPPAVMAATLATSPPPAEQPNETKTMQTQPIEQTRQNGANGSSNQAATTVSKEETKSALETALVQIESLKTGFRETINGLSKLGDSIRNAMREQKASEKEVQTVRQTLRSLQGVRL